MVSRIKLAYVIYEIGRYSTNFVKCDVCLAGDNNMDTCRSSEGGCVAICTLGIAKYLDVVLGTDYYPMVRDFCKLVEQHENVIFEEDAEGYENKVYELYRMLLDEEFPMDTICTIIDKINNMF